MNWPEIEVRYLDYLERQGYSERSFANYRRSLRQFAKWCQEEGLKDWQDLTSQELEGYQSYLMLRRSGSKRTRHPRLLSAVTRNRILSELKTLFRYLKKQEILTENPAADLELSRLVKKLPGRVLSIREMRLLLEVVPASEVGLRDLAMLEILYTCALRRSELMGLGVEDCWLQENVLKVLGKGSKERLVPLLPSTLQALEIYLRQVRVRWPGTGSRLWWCPDGSLLQDRAFMDNVCKYGQQAGLTQKLHFHLFRHTCATHLLKGKADLRSIQVLLGHAQLNTTAIYTRVDLTDLKRVMRVCHPREKDLDALE